MPAYLIVEIASVRDQETYAAYRARVSDQLKSYGGEYLARGSNIERLEGNWSPRRIVLVRFDSLEAARRWWSSEDYAELKALRQASAETNMIVVEGIEP
ncbi:MAG TPA: DUF1330 domain-containing protein [Gemmatimonadaceae bacterium]|nr:DUF1330 domain-containing protein [Gemmatimonadaceae bacterium]